VAEQSCAKCSGPNTTGHPFCGQCEDAFLAAGLCKWCGVSPRTEKTPRARQSQYCASCKDAQWRASLARLAPPPPTTKYRGDDHRENIRETKGL
jgi:hypothetical protein